MLDSTGTPWLTWSSSSEWADYASSVIHMRRLDVGTGRPFGQDATVHTLTVRDRTRESPAIIRRNGWQYLFYTRGNYRGPRWNDEIWVARSIDISGPYEEQSDDSRLILAGYGRIQGTGFPSVLLDGERYFLVHHFFDAESNERPTLQIRPLVWEQDSWPMAGEPFDGTFPIADSSHAPDVVGTWRVSNAFGYYSGAVDYTFGANGDLERCDIFGFRGNWSQEGAWIHLTLRYSGSGYTESVEKQSIIVSADGTWFVGRWLGPYSFINVIRGTRMTRDSDDQ